MYVHSLDKKKNVCVAEVVYLAVKPANRALRDQQQNKNKTGERKTLHRSVWMNGMA